MTRIVIIGGGPAGYEAALVAAQHGASVSLIDSDGIGGACVLFDCVPSKTFIASTGVRTDMRRATDLGIELDADQATVALPQIHARVKSLAQAQSSDIRTSSADRRVSNCCRRHAPNSSTSTARAWPRTRSVRPSHDRRGEGARRRRRADRHRREPADAARAPSRTASASSPGVSSTTSTRCPSTWWSSVPASPAPSSSPRTPRWACKVTLVSSRDRVLPHEDADAALVLEDVLAERGVTLVKHARADAVERTEDGIVVCSSDGRTVEGSHALMTVGSVPNTAGSRTREGRHRTRPGRLPARRPCLADRRCPGSTPQVTARACCRWRRSRPCRAASRCTTRSARA